MLEYSNKEQQQDNQLQEKQIIALNDRKTALDEQAFNLVGMRTKNEISKEHFKKHSEQIQHEIREVENQINEVQSRSSTWQEIHFNCLRFAKTALALFQEDDTHPSKRKLLALLSGLVRIRDGILSIDFPKAINTICDFHKIWEHLDKQPELEKCVENKGVLDQVNLSQAMSQIDRLELKKRCEIRVLRLKKVCF